MTSHSHMGAVFDHAGNQLYGLNAEIFLKMEAKRDKTWERGVLEWVQKVVKESLADLDDIWLSLKSGVILCKLVNVIKPGTIPKYSTTRLLPLIERDNIELFLKAMWTFGLKSSSMFRISDLYEQKSITNVYVCLNALSDISRKLGWSGAVIKHTSNTGDKEYSGKKWDSINTVPKSVHADDLRNEDTPENRLTKLQIKLNEVESELKRTKGYNVTINQELTEMRNQIKNAKQPKQDGQTNKDNQQKDLQALQNLQNEKEKLRQENETFKLQQQSEIKSLKREMSQMEDEIKSLNLKLKSNFTSKEREITRMEEEIKSLKLRKERNSSESELELQREMTRMEEEIKLLKLQKSRNSNSAELKTYQREMSRMEEEIKSLKLQKRRNSTSAELKTNQQLIAKLEAEILTLKQTTTTTTVPLKSDPDISSAKNPELFMSEPRSRSKLVDSRSSIASLRSFYSDDVNDAVLQNVQALFTNVLIGLDFDIKQSERAMTDLLTKSGELGRRAFCFVLNEVMEKTTEVNKISLSQASEGYSIFIYEQGKQPKKPKLVKIDIDKKTMSWPKHVAMIDYINSVDLTTIKSIVKGKFTKCFESFPDLDPECCLSLHFLSKGEAHTLDFCASNRIERDNFFWVLQNVWDTFKLESQGVYHNCLVLPDYNFKVVSTLTDFCISLMGLSHDSRNIDMHSVLLLMKCARGICFEVSQGHYVFIQTFLIKHFQFLSPKFWETVFWSESIKLMPTYKKFRVGSNVNNINSDTEEEAQDIKDTQTLELVHQIMKWSLHLLGWGLDGHDLKEFIKIMHGSRVNGIKDSLLFDLLKYVDCLNGEGERDDLSLSPLSSLNSLPFNKKKGNADEKDPKRLQQIAEKQIKAILKKNWPKKVKQSAAGTKIESSSEQKKHFVGMDDIDLVDGFYLI